MRPNIESSAQDRSGGRNARKLRLSWLGVAALLGLAAGCARPYGVPAFTQLVAESPSGQTASFAAPDEGTIWIDGPGHPGQPRHIIFTGLVHRGETVTIDPSAHVLLVDGKPADATIDGGKSFYQMWYQPVRHDLLVDY